MNSFGWALKQAQAGYRIARKGWNGKNMWVAYSPGYLDFPADKFWSSQNRLYAEENGGKATILPCLTIKTATGEILMGWLASGTDMLAIDWEVVV